MPKKKALRVTDLESARSIDNNQNLPIRRNFVAYIVRDHGKKSKNCFGKSRPPAPESWNSAS
jgi:hypothetical protein